MTKIIEQYIDPKRIMGEGFTPFHIITENGTICTGTFIHEENYINIFGIWSKFKGDMKKCIEYLIKKFNTNDIQFYCIMSWDILWKVKGFTVLVINDTITKEPVLCLRGKWIITDTTEK